MRPPGQAVGAHRIMTEPIKPVCLLLVAELHTRNLDCKSTAAHQTLSDIIKQWVSQQTLGQPVALILCQYCLSRDHSMMVLVTFPHDT